MSSTIWALVSCVERASDGDQARYSLDQILVDAFPTFIDLEETGKSRETVRQCVTGRGHGEVAQLGQAPFDDEDVCKGGVSDIVLQSESCHLAYGILIAAKTLHELVHPDRVLHSLDG